MRDVCVAAGLIPAAPPPTPTWMPGPDMGWFVASLILGWLATFGLARRLGEAFARPPVRAVFFGYVFVGGLYGSANLVQMSWFLITPGFAPRDLAAVVLLVFYFLLLVVLWPPWLLWFLSGIHISGL